jgi:hypothetical protein
MVIEKPGSAGLFFASMLRLIGQAKFFASVFLLVAVLPQTGRFCFEPPASYRNIDGHDHANVLWKKARVVL